MQNEQAIAILYPSLLRRIAIVIYDSLLIMTISILYGLVYIGISKFIFQIDADRPSGAFYQIGWLLAIIAFYIYFWRKGGQTTGMRAWRVEITDRDGNTPSIKQCLIRLAVFIPGWLLCLTALVDKNKQCLHDNISGTRLVLLPKESKKKA